MIKTIEELKKQASEKNITFYPVHECSICGYMCGYIISGEDVKYDSGCGCGCINYSNIKKRNWEELAETYNRNQPENNPNIKKEFLEELNKVWQF